MEGGELCKSAKVTHDLEPQCAVDATSPLRHSPASTLLIVLSLSRPTQAAEHFVRPYLKQFLGAIAPYFDVIVWSQTSWRYLEQKVVELEMVGEHAPHGLNVTCVLDRTAMFSITEEREGKPFKHEVKAMQLIWNKFPGQYSEKNTIHLDDLGRNFALNPNNGLRVHAYKDALFNSATDKELVYAAR